MADTATSSTTETALPPAAAPAGAADSAAAVPVKKPSAPVSAKPAPGGKRHLRQKPRAAHLPKPKPATAWKGWGAAPAAAAPAAAAPAAAGSAAAAAAASSSSSSSSSSALANIMSEELAHKLAREDEQAVAAEAAAATVEGESPPAGDDAGLPVLTDAELDVKIQECFARGEDPSHLFSLLGRVSAAPAAGSDTGSGSGGGGGDSTDGAAAAPASASAAPAAKPATTSSEELARQLLAEDRAAERARAAAEDKDLAMAMQLQEELDSSAGSGAGGRGDGYVDEAQRLKHQSVSSSSRSSAAALLMGGRGSNGANDAELDADDSEDEWNAAVYSNTTKHDADVCGIRNTKRLERDYDELAGLVEGRIKLSGRVANSLKQHFKKGVRKGVVQHGKVAAEERASVHGVLDKRTELVLYSWVSTGQLEKMSGALRTGKEASVFHAKARPELAHQAAAATGHSNRGLDEVLPIGAGDIGAGAGAGAATDAAVKVFKTTLSDFRNRSDYVVGDHRFAHLSHHNGRAKSGVNLRNTRQMVEAWCEKEFKNLHRLHRAGVACPQPFFFKENVMCMQFLGAGGRPAPQMHEVPLSSSAKRFRRFYEQVVAALWKMYHLCDLVHGDLSPYNILYFDKRLHIIDVGQAVVTGHPRARFFLERDCAEVTRYFARAARARGGGKCAGLPLLAPKDLAAFIVDTDLGVCTRNRRRAAAAASSAERDGGDGGGSGGGGGAEPVDAVPEHLEEQLLERLQAALEAHAAAAEDISDGAAPEEDGVEEGVEEGVVEGGKGADAAEGGAADKVPASGTGSGGGGGGSGDGGATTAIGNGDVEGAQAEAGGSEGGEHPGGWKMEMALRLATTHNGTHAEAREDNSSRQFDSVSQ